MADDEPTFRMALVLVLKRSGLYDIDDVSSGEEAIGALNHVSYDLILLDHQMGQVSGLNVMQWLHEQKIQVPVVVLTGKGSDTVAVEMMKFGAYDYIRKDQLDLNRLPAIVNTCIQGYRSRQERQQLGAMQSLSPRKKDVVGMLEDTSASFSRSAEAVLGLISDEFDEYQKRVRPNLTPSARSDVDRIMRNFQEQLKLVSLFTKTLSDLAMIARTRRDSDPSTANDESSDGGNVTSAGGSDLELE